MRSLVAWSRLSYAARMSAHSVSPPDCGTTCADNIDAFADSGMYELSVCQPSFPRNICITAPSGGRTCPSSVMLLIGASVRPRSRRSRRTWGPIAGRARRRDRMAARRGSAVTVFFIGSPTNYVLPRPSPTSPRSSAPILRVLLVNYQWTAPNPSRKFRSLRVDATEKPSSRRRSTAASEMSSPSGRSGSSARPGSRPSRALA